MKTMLAIPGLPCLPAGYSCWGDLFHDLRHPPGAADRLNKLLAYYTVFGPTLDERDMPETIESLSIPKPKQERAQSTYDR